MGRQSVDSEKRSTTTTNLSELFKQLPLSIRNSLVSRLLLVFPLIFIPSPASAQQDAQAKQEPVIVSGGAPELPPIAHSTEILYQENFYFGSLNVRTTTDTRSSNNIVGNLRGNYAVFVGQPNTFSEYTIYVVGRDETNTDWLQIEYLDSNRKKVSGVINEQAAQFVSAEITNLLNQVASSQRGAGPTPQPEATLEITAVPAPTPPLEETPSDIVIQSESSLTTEKLTEIRELLSSQETVGAAEATVGFPIDGSRPNELQLGHLTFYLPTTLVGITGRTAEFMGGNFEFRQEGLGIQILFPGESSAVEVNPEQGARLEIAKALAALWLSQNHQNEYVPITDGKITEEKIIALLQIPNWYLNQEVDYPGLPDEIKRVSIERISFTIANHDFSSLNGLPGNGRVQSYSQYRSLARVFTTESGETQVNILATMQGGLPQETKLNPISSLSIAALGTWLAEIQTDYIPNGARSHYAWEAGLFDLSENVEAEYPSVWYSSVFSEIYVFDDFLGILNKLNRNYNTPAAKEELDSFFEEYHYALPTQPAPSESEINSELEKDQVVAVVLKWIHSLTSFRDEANESFEQVLAQTLADQPTPTSLPFDYFYRYTGIMDSLTELPRFNTISDQLQKQLVSYLSTQPLSISSKIIDRLSKAKAI